MRKREAGVAGAQSEGQDQRGIQWGIGTLQEGKEWSFEAPIGMLYLKNCWEGQET